VDQLGSSPTIDDVAFKGTTTLLERLRLMHQSLSLPDIDVDAIDRRVTLLGKALRLPRPWRRSGKRELPVSRSCLESSRLRTMPMWLWFLCAVSCASESKESDCNLRTDAGDAICCGNAEERPWTDCIPPGEGRACVALGHTYDAKFIGYHCCAGLVHRPDAHVSMSESVCEVFPGQFVCIQCGDGVCAEEETVCNCLEDCGGDR
jgi:hypothetical protein